MISGVLNADGTTALGINFTSTRTGIGRYEVSFPPGTWDLTSGYAYAAIVQPQEDIEIIGVIPSYSHDGSGTLMVNLAEDMGFVFIATGFTPHE